MYNIEDEDIIDTLIEAATIRKVRVMIITSYKMTYKRNSDQFGAYQKLINNKIYPISIIHPELTHDRKIKRSMHTKICCIDNKITVTGSVNWEYHSCNNNDESMVVFRDEQITQCYKQMINNFIYPQLPSTEPNPYPLPQNISIFDTQLQKEDFVKELCGHLNKLKPGDVIYMAMFILMDFQLDYETSKDMETKQKYSVMDELRKCTERGVCLNIIVERNTNGDTFGQYYENRITPNRFIDHIDKMWENTRIWRIQTFRGNNQYAAIHHKFLVFNNTVIFGSANWWSVSFESEDDIVILTEPEIASQFIEEWYRLISPTFTVNNVPKHLEDYEEIVGVSVEIIQLNLTIPLRLNKSMNEYYGEYILAKNEINLLLDKPIQYRYCIESMNTLTKETQYDYDIPRTKSFSCYKSTDHFMELGVYDAQNSQIYLL